jgi:hypothetical protein
VTTDSAGGAPSTARSARTTVGCILAVLALAAVVRLPRVLVDDFPINDGGVFYVMIGEIARDGLTLPATTSYNGDSSPTAYPPLSLFATAALHLATGVPVLTLLRVLPVAANLATAVAVFFLARSLLAEAWLATFAAMAFAVLPRSYEYMIMGGGLTRSFGFLWGCVAVACAHRLLLTRRVGVGAAAAATLGLALLSHPEMGLWAAASVVLVVAARGLDRWSLRAVAALAAGAAVVAAPWWAVTLARHGFAPFVAAAGTSSWGLRPMLGLLSRWVVGETGLVPLTALAFLGAVAALVRRELLLPAWVVVTFAVVPRSAATPATVPLALLAAWALGEVVLPRLERGFGLRTGARRALLAVLVAAPALAYTLVVSNLRRTPETWPSLRRVPPAEREAMAWVAAHVGAAERFAVITGVETWWVDPVDAWFPALTARASVATPNGAEWLPGGEFARRVRAHQALQRCCGADPGCLTRWAESFGGEFSHVYVSARAAPAGTRQAAAMAGDAFAVVYAGAGATVLSRRAVDDHDTARAVADAGSGGGGAR